MFVLFGSCIDEDKFAFVTAEDACSAGRINRDVCVDKGLLILLQ